MRTAQSPVLVCLGANRKAFALRVRLLLGLPDGASKNTYDSQCCQLQCSRFAFCAPQECPSTRHGKDPARTVASRPSRRARVLERTHERWRRSSKSGRIRLDSNTRFVALVPSAYADIVPNVAPKRRGFSLGHEDTTRAPDRARSARLAPPQPGQPPTHLGHRAGDADAQHPAVRPR